jgi:hypothetical protein
MDMSMMIANHLAEAMKRGRRSEFHWFEREARDAAARLAAAILVVAAVFAALELGGSRMTAGDTAAGRADITASIGRHSPR